MKRFKKIMAVLMTVVLILPFFHVEVLADTTTVSLRIESSDETLYYNDNVEVELSENLTPTDVLDAAQVEWEANDWGSAKTIMDIDASWMYAVDNDSDTYPPVINEGSHIVYYPYSYNGSYSFFSEDNYNVSTGEALTVTLNELGYDDNYNSITSPSPYAQLYFKESPTGNETALQVISDSKGQATVSFNTAGTYYLTAKSLTGQNNSRPFATVEVTGDSIDSSLIDQAIKEIALPDTIDETITLPTCSNDNSCTITWSSDCADLIDANGHIDNSVLKEKTLVLLTARISDGHHTQIVNYLVTVLKNDNRYEAGDMIIESGSWLSYGYHQSITDTKTSISKESTQLKWLNAGGFEASPLIVGDYVYSVNNSNQLLKLNRQDGSEVAKSDLLGAIDYTTNIAYGDGMIFVALGDGSIQAFNASNLVSLWISESLGNPVKSQLTYYDGYLYAGTMGSSTNGVYFALKCDDEDTTKGDEVKNVVWSYQASGNRNGYYGNQSVVLNDLLYFVGDDGILVCHSLTDDKVYDTLDLGSMVRSGITYDDDYLYIMGYDTTLYKVSISDFKVVDKVQLYPNGSSTSTPTLYNNRLYVGGNQDMDDFYGAGFIAIIDASSLEAIATEETIANVQSRPLVTSAYSNDGNDHSVVVYFTCNGLPGGIYSFIDDDSKATIEIEDLYTPDSSYQQYNMNSVCVDDQGVLYFVNDSRALFALENSDANASIATKEVNKESTPEAKVDEKVKITGEGQPVIEQSNDSETAESVNTSDSTDMTLYIIVGMSSLILFIGLMISYLKNKKLFS